MMYTHTHTHTLMHRLDAHSPFFFSRLIHILPSSRIFASHYTCISLLHTLSMILFASKRMFCFARSFSYTHSFHSHWIIQIAHSCFTHSHTYSFLSILPTRAESIRAHSLSMQHHWHIHTHTHTHINGRALINY